MVPMYLIEYNTKAPFVDFELAALPICPEKPILGVGRTPTIDIVADPGDSGDKVVETMASDPTIEDGKEERATTVPIELPQ